MDHDAMMQECIALCAHCHKVCTDTATHCVEQGGRHAAQAHITPLLDCAQICQTSADFMLRHSPDRKGMCAVCAEICVRCAEDCETFSDKMMQDCAKACRACADSCERMAGQARTTAERPTGVSPA